MQSFPASPTASSLVVDSSDAVTAITIDGLSPDQSAYLFLLTILGHKAADTIARMNLDGNPNARPLLMISTMSLSGEAVAELATVAWIGTMRAIRDYLAGLPDDSPNAIALANLADKFATGSSVAPLHGEAAYQAMLRAQQEAAGEFVAVGLPTAPTGEGSEHQEAKMDDDGGPAVDGLGLAH